MPYGSDVRDAVRVLYIDDDEGIGRLVTKALRRRGHEVEHVLTGSAGIDRVAAGGIDAIGLDHSLQGETGFDILSRLGPRHLRPPVVYVTGSSDAQIAVDALKRGADDYVIKDVSGEFYELLIAAVEQAIERARLRRMRAENEVLIRQSRDRAEMLLKEVNHRVANSLGLVAAMVRMQASTLTDQGAIQALQETQSRINAIAGVHRRLYTSDKIGSVELHVYLENLMTELEASLRDDERPHRILLRAEPVDLSTDRAVSLGVIVSELVTNAFKYAYPSETEGEIRVDLAETGDGRVEVRVSDDGPGFDPQGPSQGTGLGTRITAAMAKNLGADLSYEAAHASGEGSCVVLTFTCESTPAMLAGEDHPID